MAQVPNPRNLVKPQSLPVHGYSGTAFERLNLVLFSDDAMFDANHIHYLSVGASALNVIEACRALAGWPPGWLCLGLRRRRRARHRAGCGRPIRTPRSLSPTFEALTSSSAPGRLVREPGQPEPTQTP